MAVFRESDRTCIYNIKNCGKYQIAKAAKQGTSSKVCRLIYNYRRLTEYIMLAHINMSSVSSRKQSSEGVKSQSLIVNLKPFCTSSINSKPEQRKTHTVDKINASCYQVLKRPHANCNTGQTVWYRSLDDHVLILPNFTGDRKRFSKWNLDKANISGLNKCVDFRQRLILTEHYKKLF